ncbi:hypothetical protein LUI11_36925 [Bradyrhizobium diazoefficiens]|uniref:Uncharacterized protein n=1 Tax=Bradyrhizobium diazoefficiens TaxID=1355477 RepID=A0A0E4FWD9_9BRAD|nr:hypothetical protein [Bradyrhizobium diazoefficiens]MCD9298028.1 hypothetical protein [Bradyrhizobium diazoefficiens]MCD9815507.1 hypothetical protein [Bradyrhizobium diazoefficiens]MCD9833435.1 hypothetical protein [Bradyrhizobium diazoefficiens]MCD9852103.1 hypothetical protein [Bradyrhizobium diazoefficiens]MCD9888350.1 hypothetical protein [Bradyrhizobium diazoefficiens]
MSASRLRLISIDNPNEVIEPATDLDDDYIAASHQPVLNGTNGSPQFSRGATGDRIIEA